jgi:hypothetical protein
VSSAWELIAWNIDDIKGVLGTGDWGLGTRDWVLGTGQENMSNIWLESEYLSKSS